MENHRFYLSTIAADAAGTARQYALGLEIAEYCTACNMDEHFPETDAAVREGFVIFLYYSLFLARIQCLLPIAL